MYLSILCFTKSDRDAKLAIPLCVSRSTKASELSFMLLEDFNHPLKDLLVTSIAITLKCGFNKLRIAQLSALLKREPKAHETGLTLLV